jgi:hypothetical protein
VEDDWLVQEDAAANLDDTKRNGAEENPAPIWPRSFGACHWNVCSALSANVAMSSSLSGAVSRRSAS